MLELQPGEFVITYLRRHPFLFVLRIFWSAVFFAIPFFFLSSTLKIPFVSSQVAVFLGAVWSLCFFMRMAVVWTNYYLDMWVVTNIRIVDVEQTALFRRKVSTLELENIQDVTIKIDGFWQTAIGYGTLFVQTAGKLSEFIITDITDPEGSKQIIYEAQRKHKLAHTREVQE